jgi:hypothetical protein
MRFNLHIAAIACASALASSSILADEMDLGGGVYSPEKGIICDRNAGFCADGTGISMTFTEEYLGSKAVKKFSKNIEGGSFNYGDFVLSDGRRCKTQEQKCYHDKHGTKVAKTLTKRLFK